MYANASLMIARNSNIFLCDRGAIIRGFSFALGYPPPTGQQIQWMQAPPPPANCPPGLEYLTQVDQLLIKQQVELLEGMYFLLY